MLEDDVVLLGVVEGLLVDDHLFDAACTFVDGPVCWRLEARLECGDPISFYRTTNFDWVVQYEGDHVVETPEIIERLDDVYGRIVGLG